MRRVLLFAGLLVPGFSTLAQEPPRLLPSSITGVKPDAAVTPASGTVAPPVAPIARFQDARAFPPETHAVLLSARTSADWLWRMNQSTGRFLPGVNPITRTGLSPDDDYAQAIATLALVEAAKFTGEDRLAVRATQAVLTMLTLTKADGDRRVPTVAKNRVGFAAALMMAIRQLPGADAKLLAQADALGAFLRTKFTEEGAVPIETGDDWTGGGLAIHALALSHRANPDAATLDTLRRAMHYYTTAFRTKPFFPVALAVLPGLVEFALQEPVDTDRNSALYEMANLLIEHQYTRADGKNPAWAGGFRLSADASEPTFVSADVALAIVHVTRLTRRAADLAKFTTYRRAAVSGLLFTNSLQFTEENADQFERSFRQRYMIGGVHASPTDGVLRVEATARTVRATLAFLQSGAESRVDE